jgi:hypothetical protein
LTSKEAVDIFVRDVIANHPTFNEHQDISSGELIIDNRRMGYIGSLIGKELAVWAIWEDLELGDGLASIIGAKDALYICIPVI